MDMPRNEDSPLLPTSSADQSKSRTKAQFRRTHQYERPIKPSPWQQIKPSWNRQTIFNFIPILKWLPNYNFKEHLLWDLIAGLTVSVLLIPHGLAFAPLGGQAPVVGLYMAIFPVFIYALLGTSRHISLGMQAILVIMIGKIVENYGAIAEGNGETYYSPLDVCIACTFTIGLWQILLSIFQLGSLCVLLSNSLISGLTSAAAIHIIFFQLKHIFGINLVMPSGPLKLIYATYDLFINLSATNLVVFAISLAFMVFLTVFNFYIKPILAKKTKIPVPMEFLLICLSVGLSWALDLGLNYNVKVVGQLGQVGNIIPMPMLPPFELIPKIAFDCLIIALVNISINISVVNIFAKKGKYEIRENQEIFAYGGSNIFGAIFQSLPVCTALSRSMIQFSVGGKTELTHLICLSSVLFMLFFLAPFFELIPLCVLAAIVIVTMIPLLAQIKDFPNIWRLSKSDGIIWLVTFVVVILVDLDYGIGFGLLTSLLMVFINTNRVSLTVLTKIEDCFVEQNRYQKTEKVSDILFLQISGCVNFVNCAKVFKNAKKECEIFWQTLVENGVESKIILNFGKVISIDPTAVNELKLFCNFVTNGKNSKIFLAECSETVYNILLKCKFFEVFEEDHVLLSLEDAYDLK